MKPKLNPEYEKTKPIGLMHHPDVVKPKRPKCQPSSLETELHHELAAVERAAKGWISPKCQHREVPNLPRLILIAKAKAGKKQHKCPICRKWIWESYWRKG